MPTFSPIKTIRNIFISIWLILILPLLWVSIQVVEGLPNDKFLQHFYDTALGQPFRPGWPLAITLSILGFLLVSLLLTSLLSFFEWYRSGGKALHIYLQAIENEFKELRPTGIKQSSGTGTLTLINVPLNEVFIHLRTIADRPLYDTSLEEEQKKFLLAALQRNWEQGRISREDYLAQQDQAQHKQLVSELLNDLSSQNTRQLHAFTSIINIYLRYLRYLRYLINSDQIINMLCYISNTQGTLLTPALLAIYSVLSNYEDIPKSTTLACSS